MKKSTLLSSLWVFQKKLTPVFNFQKLFSLAVICCLMLVAGKTFATIRYVKAGATGDGSSWSSASGDFQGMINASAAGDQVWVAAGTYKPTTGTNRTIYFSMKEGVAIYGGFTGSESTLNQRPAITYSQPSTSILSGDIGNPNDNSDNSFHVIYNYKNGLSGAAVLDGFVVSNGNANGTDYSQQQDEAGGIHNSSASPTIRNCLFKDNAANVGGAMMNSANKVALSNCSFVKNTGPYSGGAIAGRGCSGTLTNCVFFNNSCSNEGGAIYNFSSSLTYINCTFSGNSAGATGGAIHNNQNDHPTFINCILWGNSPNQLDDDQGSSSTVKNSNIDQDGFAGQNGNIRQDPFFINTTNGNLEVLDCSLTLNKGDDAANATNKDIDGNPRKNGTIDMGAFENQHTPTTPTLITTQPLARETVNKGDNVTATVATSGPVVAYQWYKDGKPVPGQTTATLSLVNVQAGQSGNYTVKITGSCNTLISNIFTLIIPARFYVNAAVSESGDGTSWATAFKTLQEAIVLPSAIEVWVAGGTYKPTSGTDQDATFSIPNGLKVYGGFAGAESNLAERSLSESNKSILSGDIGITRDDSDNSKHLVTFNSANNETRLDGFVITRGGNSNVLGGGIYNSGNSNPVIANCHITQNSASEGGGVFSNVNGAGASPTFINCSFTQNKAQYNGGAIYIGYSDNLFTTTFTNCSFSHNQADEGGAIYNQDFSSTNHVNLNNCIVWNNPGGGLNSIYDFRTEYNVYNSIIDNGKYNGSNNINKDPLFVDADNGDLHLQPCSPAINSGNNEYNSTVKDLSGHSRVAGNTIDIGAYEFQGQTGPATIINMPQPATVCAGTAVKFRVTATGTILGFQWQKNGIDISGATDSVYSMAAIALADSGKYSVIVSGCGSTIASVAARLTVNLAPAPVVTVADNCGSSLITTNATGRLLWSTGETTPSITVNKAGTYTVTQTANGCISAAGSGTAAPKAAPTVSVSDERALNSGVDVNTVYVGYAPASSITLTAIPQGGSGTYTYKWSTGAGTASIKVNPASQTTYTVTVTDIKGCVATVSKLIKVADVRCGNKMDKVSICHSGNTLCIDKEGVADHLLHGDYLGDCRGTTLAGIMKTNAIEAEAAEFKIKASPNPATAYFKLAITSPNVVDKISVSIIDELGRVVETRTVNAGQTLQVGERYRTGIYIAQAMQGNKRVTVKLVKQSW